MDLKPLLHWHKTGDEPSNCQLPPDCCLEAAKKLAEAVEVDASRQRDEAVHVERRRVVLGSLRELDRYRASVASVVEPETLALVDRVVMAVEAMLRDPNEQFDRRSELLKPIVEYANAESATASDHRAVRSPGRAATMTDLPKWMWDVLADLLDHEDVHAKDDHCVAATLEYVPAEILRGARLVQRYREKVDEPVAEN